MTRPKPHGAGELVKVSVWIDASADRELEEMSTAWFPGYQRVKGAVLTRAVHQLYKQFQREQRSQQRADA